MVSFLAAINVVEILTNPMFAITGCLMIFYFVYLRSQNKKQKELDAWLSNLNRGEEVITTGGFLGRVHESEKGNPYVVLEFQDKVRVKVLRSYIAGKPPEFKSSAAEQKTSDKDKKETKS